MNPSARREATVPAAFPVPRPVGFGGRRDWWRPVPAEGEEPGARPEPPPASRTEGSEVPFRALMAFTFVLLLAPQQLFPVLAPLHLGLLAAVVAVAAHLADRFSVRRPLTIVTREMGLAVGLAAWAVVTVPMSLWPGGSVEVLLTGYLKTLVVFCLLVNVLGTYRRLRLMILAMSLMTAPLAAFGIHTFLSGEYADVGPVNRIATYEAPLTANPNDLALMLNLVLPLTVGLFLSQRRPVLRALLLVLIGMDAFAIIATFSRAGFITLGVTVMIYVVRLLRRPERRWAVAGIAIMILSAPLLPASYLARLGTIANISMDPTGSAQARWDDTFAALTFISRNPIAGAGVGMDALALNEIRGVAWKEVHNVYLQHAVDLGLPGLALFLLLLVGCIQAAGSVRRRAARSPGQQGIFCIAEGIQGSLVAFAVAAVFHPVAYHFYFYYIAGLAIAVRAVYESRPTGSGAGTLIESGRG